MLKIFRKDSSLLNSLLFGQNLSKKIINRCKKFQTLRQKKEKCSKNILKDAFFFSSGRERNLLSKIVRSLHN